MLKINLYGGPGSGKSTLSTILFSELKLREKRVELVREYAKELVYQEKDMINLVEADRIYILAEQMRREAIHYGKIDYLITDSPVLIAAYYYRNRSAIDLAKGLLMAPDRELHFLIRRDETLPFEKYGRAHDEDAAKKIDQDMRDFLEKEGIKYHEISGSPDQRLASIIKVLGMPHATEDMKLKISL